MSLQKGQNKYFLNSCFKCKASELLLFLLILFTIYLLAYHVSDCLLSTVLFTPYCLPTICTQGKSYLPPIVCQPSVHRAKEPLTTYCLPTICTQGNRAAYHHLSLLYMVTRQWKAYSEKKSRQSHASPVPLHMSICSQLSPPCYVGQNTSRNDFTSHKWNPWWETELKQKVFHSLKPQRVKPWQEQEVWKSQKQRSVFKKIKVGMSDLKLNHMYRYTHIHACTHTGRGRCSKHKTLFKLKQNDKAVQFLGCGWPIIHHCNQESLVTNEFCLNSTLLHFNLRLWRNLTPVHFETEQNKSSLHYVSSVCGYSSKLYCACSHSIQTDHRGNHSIQTDHRGNHSVQIDHRGNHSIGTDHHRGHHLYRLTTRRQAADWCQKQII